MQILGLEIRRKAAVPSTRIDVPSTNNAGWFPLFRSHVDLQTADRPISQETILAYFAVYSCLTLIAGDMAKMCWRLLRWLADDEVWNETDASPYLTVLQQPNRFQNPVMFVAWWIMTKLIHGNTYALKVRDGRGIVTSLYILDACRVSVLIAPSGDVFYELPIDNLSGLEKPVRVPAREIIHDVMKPLYHPLCGVSPITACASAAVQGLRIQDQSSRFFANGAQPSGVLTAPGLISDAAAKRAQEWWETNMNGPQNAGKVAVLGDGLKYEPMTMTARDAQLIDQLRWTAEVVCSCFHVPPHKINIGQMPNYNNIEALDQQYYSQCIATLRAEFLACVNKGLELPGDLKTDLDLDDLIAMDSATKVENESKLVGAGIGTPNESRKKFNRKPLPGGNTVYMQQQDVPLEAAAKNAGQPMNTPPVALHFPTIPTTRTPVEADLDLQRVKASLLRRYAA